MKSIKHPAIRYHDCNFHQALLTECLWISPNCEKYREKN